MEAPDQATEVWLIRGEGGDITAHQLPLGEGIPGRLRSGALLRVNPDGSPWEGPALTTPPASLAEKRAADQLAAQASAEPVERPLVSAKKAEWVEYAASTGTITQEAAADLTKDELVKRYGGEPS